jgi:hypothetical protein
MNHVSVPVDPTHQYARLGFAGFTTVEPFHPLRSDPRAWERAN